MDGTFSLEIILSTNALNVAFRIYFKHLYKRTQFFILKVLMLLLCQTCCILRSSWVQSVWLHRETMDIFWVKTMLLKKFLRFSTANTFLLRDIEESTIRFSDFDLLRVQWWLNRFVYITTNHNCCPLNCSRAVSRPRAPSSGAPTLCPLAPHSQAPQQLPLACQAGISREPDQACQLPSLALHL